MISVLANLNKEWDGSYKPEKICIYKEGKELLLERDEWQHLCEVLAGRCNKATSPITDDDYIPESMTVWSTEWTGGTLQ